MTALTDDNYAAFREPPSTNLQIVLRQLADELTQAEMEVEHLQKELEFAQDKVKGLVNHRIPDATDGIDGELDLGDGRKLVIKEEIRASIAGEKKKPAIQWLDENGYEALVKRQLVFEFDRKDVEKYKMFVRVLKEAGVEVVMTEKFDVPWQTITSWVRQRLKDGDEIPLETFGVFRQRTAKIKEQE